MRKTLLVLVIGLTLAPPGGAQPETPSANRLRPPEVACPICDLWLQYENVFLRAKQEVGRLDQGVFYFHHSEDPDVIEALIRFAHERERLAGGLKEDVLLRARLGRACGHARGASDAIHLEISTSARGAIALLRCTDRTRLGELRRDAERATLARVPAWY